MSRRTIIRFSKEEKNKIASLANQPQRLRDFLDALIKAKSNPSIDDFSPIRGYPGTEIQITGKNFAETREGNKVTIGGEPATVIEAKPDSLTILSSPLTKTGSIEVVANSKKAIGPVKFEALGRPKPGQDGPPIFYEGSGTGIAQGAPSTGTLRVLIVLCQANNLAPPNATTTRNNIVNTFNSVNTFYDQASYDQLNVQVDVTTNWRTLDGTINDFMDGDNLDYTMLDQIIAEAAQQAVDEGFNLNDYTLIAALVYTNQDIRCWGGGSY